ncbi:Protein argonaute-2 [Termitomyces sp. J132]|nr:Protein argonaute-2 [Termitomyces sp. J132]
MPPRSTSRRGGPRGSPQPSRGASRGRDANRGDIQPGGSPVGLASSAHVKTVGVRRPGYGTAGRQLAIVTNSIVTTIPDTIIRHYDDFSSDLHPRIRRLLLKKLEEDVAPNIFRIKTVFDGRKNLFASYELDLGASNSRQFDVILVPRTASSERPPKVYKVKITKVNEINPEVLHAYVNGRYSIDEEVLTAIMALNVVVRMDPSEKYPFNVRSFFTDKEIKNIGMGIVLWRGFFQSVRPGIGRMLINVDISTGMMYKPGNLIDLCLDFFEKQNPNLLAPSAGLPDRERLRLQRFLIGLKVTTPHTNSTRPNAPPRVIKKLSSAGANALRFNMNGVTITVADYFRTQANRPLRFPANICVEVGSGALIPLELCHVPAGQIMKKQIPPEKTKDMVEFSTMKPAERFQSISNGLSTVLSYGQSEYVRSFGMSVDTAAGFLPITARKLDPPKLKYGQGSKQPTIQPRDGSWNMIDKKFYKAEDIRTWVVVSYESQRRFSADVAKDMVTGLVNACKTVGMRVRDPDPIIRWENAQGRVAEQLRAAGSAAAEKAKREGFPGGPNLIVVILPDGGNEIYNAVKHFGDITMGVATQCLKSSKCYRAKIQYWANVCLKINPKLGGINTIPDPASVQAITDPKNPTIVMGADVIHPAPGSQERPSFTAVVGNVDSDNAKYIATMRVQTSRQEMIDDLKDMCKEILQKYTGYRAQVEKQSQSAPKRLIFYRDGVSEGQFQQVLDLEACAELKMTPKITVIIVGKRHHVRFKTQDPRDSDRSGNCPAGTVVDREIGHPTEFDYFLQSHGGLLGTSRPAHYSVLYDENNFNSSVHSADSMQALSFALCHVYARSTRSVSIPAPVYYADIVCSRAKIHYDPSGSLDFSDTVTATGSQATATLESFQRDFKPLHANTSRVMYFSVRWISYLDSVIRSDMAVVI